jgi:hypothetical protein
MGMISVALKRRLPTKNAVEHRRCFGAGQEAEGATRVRGRKLVAGALFGGCPFKLEKRGAKK